jgi:hypothetical protein
MSTDAGCLGLIGDPDLLCDLRAYCTQAHVLTTLNYLQKRKENAQCWWVETNTGTVARKEQSVDRVDARTAYGSCFPKKSLSFNPEAYSLQTKWARVFYVGPEGSSLKGHPAGLGNFLLLTTSMSEYPQREPSSRFDIQVQSLCWYAWNDCKCGV